MDQSYYFGLNPFYGTVIHEITFGAFWNNWSADRRVGKDLVPEFPSSGVCPTLQWGDFNGLSTTEPVIGHDEVRCDEFVLFFNE